MRKALKLTASFLLIPLTRWYLKKDRLYSYQNVRVVVRRGVFHPGLFHSTKLILSYISNLSLKGKNVIEVGSGTGLISVVCAKANARVTAIDLNPIAVDNTVDNAQSNNVSITILHSDLFNAVDHQVFDYIIINPPYYARNPIDDKDLAWYCGENFEYFTKLFTQLPGYTSESTEIIMVLTKGCDLTSIRSIASQHGFVFSLIKQQRVLFDGVDYLFRILPIDAESHPV